jgi:hypothetical protein
MILIIRAFSTVCVYCTFRFWNKKNLGGSCGDNVTSTLLQHVAETWRKHVTSTWHKHVDPARDRQQVGTEMQISQLLLTFVAKKYI